jgi:hypothetical protein
MHRRLLNILAALSLLLAMMTGWLWVRSYRGGDVVGWPHGTTAVWTIVSLNGAMSLKMLDETETPFTGTWRGDRRPGDDQLFWESAATSNKVWQVRPLILPYEVGWYRTKGAFAAQQFSYQYRSQFSFQRVAVAGRKFAITMPHWAVAIALLLPSLPSVVLAVRSYASRGRTCAGLCSNCGYDLRASPERCPECGTTARPVST